MSAHDVQKAVIRTPEYVHLPKLSCPDDCVAFVVSRSLLAALARCPWTLPGIAECGDTIHRTGNIVLRWDFACADKHDIASSWSFGLWRST